MGSLFDGIGGFPLGAIHNGVIPLWASEIEPFPIRVTQQRLPGMLHYGDITKLNGAILPPVDIICGGSPCQDLSVAGARAGLAGERSGLFMEQIRIVKEMRDADILRGRTGIHVRPRFLCAAVGLCFACLGRGGKEQAMEEKKNLCAPIPLSLHQRLRAEQEQRGQTLSDYITDILREHFEGGTRTMHANNRTIAFQVPEELFGRLKDYLARNGLKQKDFILGLIERELNDAGNEE